MMSLYVFGEPPTDDVCWSVIATELRRPSRPRRLPLLVALLAFLVPGGAVAYPRPPCGDTETIRQQLADRHGEAPVAAGITLRGNMIQIFASEDHSTWTVVITRPGGPSCLMQAGRDWMTIEHDIEGPGS